MDRVSASTGGKDSSQGQSDLASTAPGTTRIDDPGAREVIAFSADGPLFESNAGYEEFNLWYQSPQAYEFKIPGYAVQPHFPQSVWCQSSLKALMATMASMMGDRETFDQIVEATDRMQLQDLGRRVTRFQEKRWERHLQDTAFEITRQKFKADRHFAGLLFSTNNALILYAEPNDRILGAGISVMDVLTNENLVWNGKNVLGEALMRVRDTAFNGRYLLEGALK